ncbi:hypothetical protein Q5424_15845 [Conexibacter sp. JD483]|uniref:hypothetical protein n=1 Tax=unclassified Conexibacter TaxID=2627773 RepID=UPI00271EC9F0|nr:MULTISPECIES: hypothetical protein [unclassified Conexibacter]MDO8186447.1 hypothetical protein [Conexibacter sp. CPCC 205706]MDO8200016.1 hypothetical protein [Conexibacter sp. CPCC 205762]MDR9370569.1 hypothetical protein [Conexibacter sp. JD483]
MPRFARVAALVVVALSPLVLAPAGASAAPATATAAGRLVTVTAPGVVRGGISVRWRTTTKLASARLTLNGRRVAAANRLVLKGARARLALDAADGVRFGSNRLVAQVVGKQGRRQTVRRTVVVRRDAPLPAVQTRGGRVAGRTIRLDGRGTRSTSPSLSYRWRVVRAPRGAKARLVGARTTTPRLVGSLPGRYGIALTVRERSRGKRSPAFLSASGCSVAAKAPSGEVPAGPRAPVASTPAARLRAAAISVVKPTTGAASPLPAGAATAGCTTHVESVDVGVNALPIGVAIDTHALVRGVRSIVVGDRAFPLPAAGDGAAAAIFDAETMELISFVSPLPQTLGQSPVTAFQAAAQQSSQYVKAGQPVLIVAAGVAGCCGTDTQDSAAGFSAIATYGSVNGGASPTLNEGQILGGPETVAGEQIGWLQPGVPLDGAAALYGFVSPDRATFDTQAATTALSNTMQVNGTTYPGTLPAGTTAGYQVLVLDASLTPQLGTPITYGTVGTAGPAAEQQMAQLLQQASTLPGSTTLVQSIDDPSPQSPSALASAKAIGALGGSPWMFLSGNASYALVGNPIPQFGTDQIAPWAAETQSGWTAAASGRQGGGNGTLSGVLRRRGDSAWASSVQSALADTDTPPDFGLSLVAVQPAVQWPYDATPGQIAATTWIAEQLGLQPGPGSCWQPSVPDFRSSYCNEAIDWDSIGDELTELGYPTASKPSFSRTDFVNVRRQLGIETGNIGTITALIGTLQAPFTASASGVPVDAQAIAGEVINAIPPPSPSSTNATLSIFASILEAAAIVPEVGSLLGALGASLDFTAAMTQTDGTTRPYWQVQTSADQMGAQMLNTLQTMSGHLDTLEEILVSDWGRMSAAVAGAEGPWGVNGGGLAQQESVMQLGVEQAMWTGILPAAFTLNSFPGVQDAAQVSCVTTDDPQEWLPWGKAASIGSFLPLNTWQQSPTGGMATSSGVSALLSGDVDTKSSVAVSPALAGQMFGPPQQQGAGLIQPWLYARANWTVVSPSMNGQNNECQIVS